VRHGVVAHLVEALPETPGGAPEQPLDSVAEAEEQDDEPQHVPQILLPELARQHRPRQGEILGTCGSAAITARK